MERSGITRWLFIGLTVLLAVTFLPKLFGEGSSEQQPLKFEGTALPAERKPEQLCDIWGPRFHAQVTTQGASLKHFYLVTAKYRQKGKSIDLSTTPDVELRRQLRFHFRNERFHPADDWQLDFDEVDYELVKADGKSCELVYRDAKVEVRRVVRATEHPYELEAEATVTNLADKKLKHALTVHTDAWRTNKEVESGMFAVSPFITHVECVSEANKATRMRPPDFEPDSFKGEGFSGPLNQGDWYETKEPPAYAAVSNAYFSHAIAPVAAPGDAKPTCQLQIEDRWDVSRFKAKGSDPGAGAMYRARLAWAPVELGPKESARYAVLTYVGPKERDVLAGVGGGKRDLTELIDLGFFSVIAKVLVAFLLKVHSILPNWGIAIILLTLAARVLLFPLAVPSIKSMIKMRELKPELDAITEKFKDDAQAKGLAQMELWRKHNVNPLKGCLPQLASMPVWFALYTTLQTAVELFNIPFLWFPDLSQPDRFFILPFIIGATNFAQQKLMPMQGDPMQQKMMLYFMPAMFTVFMLFLPSGLGVYMFTNGLLTIAQQQIVESYVKRQTLKSEAEKKSREIGVKIKEEASS
ncbi:MAG: membrane protein insertase YidC [Myxococcales bacterium]|nr:membrane protein insertase YidC [Myxococcales bacterium]